ncbi:hypothetical protein KIW84_022216 [Lathyrus oleraceus]|uniref:Uncharacterized protein n=1 Tax=Pisum sativum TaxID=3888 RepID=A0A9D4Y9X3_PEA|nr:hypothetical protein KIW84_022216 [Pisum sativum]
MIEGQANSKAEPPPDTELENELRGLIENGESLPTTQILPGGTRTVEPNLQHDVSETSNMLSINSSHDSLSENAESKQILMNKYQDTKHSEGHDDNASCINRASDANLVNDSHQRNADKINIPCSSASASHFGVERSGIAPSVEETPSSKDVENDHSSPTIQR